MARAETFPALKARERRRRFVRVNWWRLGVIAGAMAVVSALIGVWFPDWHIPVWAALMIGFVLVGAIAHPMFDGTYHLWSADEAEGWTRSELNKLKREGWGVTGRVPFEYRDVDHVAVRGSQVFAIDTKYTDSEIEVSGYRDRRIVEEWAEKASHATLSLRSLLVLSHRLEVEVIPIVVVWGSEVTGEPQFLNRVMVVRGRDLQEELRKMRVGKDERNDQARAVSVIEDFRQKRATHQREAARRR